MAVMKTGRRHKHAEWEGGNASYKLWQHSDTRHKLEKRIDYADLTLKGVFQYEPRQILPKGYIIQASFPYFNSGKHYTQTYLVEHGSRTLHLSLSLPSTSIMSTAIPPTSYASIGYKDIEISHVPASAPEATKVLMVALNRPDKFNAVTENLLNELEAAYRLFDQDERVRAIVLTGNGRAFCAGADLTVGFSGLLAYKETEESMTKFRDQ